MEIGKVIDYFAHVGVAAIELSEDLAVGDTIRITGGDVDFEQKVSSMQIDRMDVKEAKAGESVGIIVDQKVRKGYGVFRLTNGEK